MAIAGHQRRPVRHHHRVPHVGYTQRPELPGLPCRAITARSMLPAISSRNSDHPGHRGRRARRQNATL